MIIKTYAAESAAAALKMVRAELGSDAVVLKTRELPQGRGSERIEITACADKVLATEPERQQIAPKPSNRQAVRASFPQVTTIRESAQTILQSTPAPVSSAPETTAGSRLDTLEQKVDRILSLLVNQSGHTGQQQLRSTLVDRDLPTTFIEEIMIASIDGIASARTTLTDSLTSMMRPGLALKPGDSLAVLGFAGAGKTSALGKLAARLVFQDKQVVRLVTLDSVKIGAFEELSSYADILGSPAVDFATAKSTAEPKGITLIDTPALPRQQQQLVTLCEQLDALHPAYRVAVISALTRSTDTEMIAEQLAAFAPTHLIITMLDLTERWGSAVTASRSSKLPICYITNAPAGMGTVVAPDAAAFTKMFLTEETNA